MGFLNLTSWILGVNVFIIFLELIAAYVCGCDSHMRRISSVVFLATTITFAGGFTTNQQFHCDMVTHMARKPFVSDRSELLMRGQTKLRILMINIPTDAIQRSVSCPCERTPLPDHEGRLTKAAWKCGQDLEILEMEWKRDTPVNHAHEEEVRIRVQGKVPWGAALKPVEWGWSYLGYHYDSWYTATTEEAPLVILYHDLPISRSQFDTTLLHSHLQWSRPWNPNEGDQAPVRMIRTMMYDRALVARDGRAYTKGKTDGMQTEKEFQEQQRKLERYQHAEQLKREFERGKAEGLKMASSTKSTSTSTVAVTVPCGSSLPNPDWMALLECPITKMPLVDPVINRVDGYTYSKAAIVKWIQEQQPTSPMTRQPTVLEDLVPNRVVQDLLNTIRG